MQRPGFWDDQATAAEISARHARAQRRLEGFRKLESDVGDLEELAELAADDEEMAGELADQLASVEQPAGRARGGAALLGPLRRRRRRGHRQRRRGRHRLPGLGRDAAAHVPALGRAARLQGGDEGGLAGGGGGPQVRDLHRARRERLRAVRRRARRPPADPDLPLRLLGAPSHQLRPGRRRAPGGGRRRRGDRRRATSASTPTAPRAPAASTSTRPTPPCGSPTSRPGSLSSARTSARRRRTRRPRCSSCGPAARAEGAGARRGAGEGAGRAEVGGVGLADPQLLPPPRPAGEGPPHRLRGRATPSASSTATSTASFAST